MLLRDLLARRVRNAILLVGIALCCLPAAAFAARQSLVSITRDVIQGGKGTIYSTPVPPKTLSIGSSSPATIMIPADFFTGMTLSEYTSPGPYPYVYRLKDRGNLPGTFVPANPLGPSGLETAYAHQTTTLCNVYPTTFPQGSCAPRYGVMKMQDTGNKFGGTLRLTDNGFVKGHVKQGGQTYYFFYQISFTAMRTAPMYLGIYGIGGTGKLTNINLPSQMLATEFQSTEGPFTTGYVYVWHSGAGINAKTTVTGYDNRYATTAGNVKGTVSLIRPILSHTFSRDAAGNVDSGFPFALVERLKITFMPEPSQLLSLGCCALALGALYRSRGR
jgi:hypothetical protein